MTQPVTYLAAPEVAEQAMPLIVEHHPELVSAPIVYVFRTPTLRTRNKWVLGRALRVMGLNAFLVALAAGDASDDLLEAAGRRYAFYVMELALDEWRYATVEQQRALVDHELCHFAPDPESGELKIRAHDVEEFIEVVARHGAWNADVAAFGDVCATPV